MQSQQFKIEAWEFQQPLAPLSHRHQLKPLQQIIAKAKAARKPLQLQTTYNQTQQTNSFLSLKANHRKYHTEQIYKNTSSVQIISNVLKPQMKKKLIQHTQHSKNHQQLFLNIYKLKRGESSHQIVENSPKYELKHIKNIKAKEGQKIESKGISTQNQQQQKISNSRMANKYSRIKRYRTTSSSNSCLVVLPNFELKPKNRVKSFFIQTIHTLDDARSTGERAKVNPRKTKNDQTPDNSNRWKNMVEKSNRKKKELEDLFKTRPLFGKNQIQRRIVASNLSRILQEQSKKALIQRKAKNQFDDKSLYCPWSYREQRLVNHLKNKQNK